MIRYVSVEQVFRANERHGANAGVRDRAAIESAVARPQAGFGGVEAHPTVWLKAAALLHGLVSTQGFHDGNKRTGWAVTIAFLRANSQKLPPVPVIQAEAFVMSVAVSAWANRTVVKAAEWLEDLGTGKTALDEDALELLVNYRGQSYLTLGTDPFVLLKAYTTPLSALSQKPWLVRQTNIVVPADEALPLAELLRRVWDDLPKPGVRRRAK